MVSKGKNELLDCIVVYRPLVANLDTVPYFVLSAQHHCYPVLPADITGKDQKLQRCIMASDALKEVFQVCYPHNDPKQELLLGTANAHV